MPTVIEHSHSQNDSGLGNLLAVVLILALAVLFFIYGLPYVSNAFRTPQVNVPSQIDVNVQQPK